MIDKLKTSDKEYHFIEVMTCPGGCIGGGGQPKDKKHKGNQLRESRIESLYSRDKEMSSRTSHGNTEIIKLYNEFYGSPISELSEQMLHTTYFDQSKYLG